MIRADLLSAAKDDDRPPVEVSDTVVAVSLGGTCVVAVVCWVGFLAWGAGRLLSFW